MDSTAAAKASNPLDALLLVAAAVKKGLQKKDPLLPGIKPTKLAELTASCYRSLSRKERVGVNTLATRQWICDPYRKEYPIEQGYHSQTIHAPEPAKSGAITFSYSKFVKDRQQQQQKEDASKKRRLDDDEESLDSNSSIDSEEDNGSTKKRSKKETNFEDEIIEVKNFPSSFSKKTKTVLESKIAREQLFSDLFNQFTPATPSKKFGKESQHDVIDEEINSSSAM